MTKRVSGLTSIRRRLILVLPVAGGLWALTACGRQQPPPPPPVQVEVVPAVEMDVPIVGEWIGTLDGSVDADIRPKVEGYLVQRLYRKEGQFVRRNDPLFEIDPRQFRAAVQEANATLARAETQLAKATRDAERLTPLAADRAVSRQELDDALAAEHDARSAVDAARAAMEQAALNLAWTRVTSPIDGIVGIAKAQVGDLVNTTTIMTTVSTVDPIRATFGISEGEYMARAAWINQRSYADTPQGPAVELVLQDGTVFPFKSTASAVDREVNAKTGTLTINAFFPNPGNILRPGQFARVRAAFDVRKGAVVVPQRAVTELQGGARVAVVGADETAEFRSVELGPRTGELWVVEKGLGVGENVIVGGLAHVRPGAKVTARPASSASPAASSHAEPRR